MNESPWHKVTRDKDGQAPVLSLSTYRMDRYVDARLIIAPAHRRLAQLFCSVKCRLLNQGRVEIAHPKIGIKLDGARGRDPIADPGSLRGGENNPVGVTGAGAILYMDKITPHHTVIHLDDIPGNADLLFTELHPIGVQVSHTHLLTSGSCSRECRQRQRRKGQ